MSENYPSFEQIKGIHLQGLNSQKRWTVSGNKSLGSGVEAIVCLGKPEKKEDPEVALKIAYENTSLFYEKNVFKSIGNGVLGIPHFYDEGFNKEKQLIFFAEELLGNTLDSFLERNGGTLPLETVMRIANQLIERFEALHSKGFVLRDISPKNIMTGVGSHTEDLYFIDLGCAKSFFKIGDTTHIPSFKMKQVFEGTPIFGSIHSLKGGGHTRRDDMEALGYLLIYCIKGTLPWESSAKQVKIWNPKSYFTLASQKEKVGLDQLCSDLPDGFKKYLSICLNLGFDEKPNYAQLKKLFPVSITSFNWSQNSGKGNTEKVVQAHEEDFSLVKKANSKSSKPKNVINVCDEEEKEEIEPPPKKSKKITQESSPVKKSTTSKRNRSQTEEVEKETTGSRRSERIKNQEMGITANISFIDPEPKKTNKKKV